MYLKWCSLIEKSKVEHYWEQEFLDENIHNAHFDRETKLQSTRDERKDITDDRE